MLEMHTIRSRVRFESGFQRTSHIFRESSYTDISNMYHDACTFIYTHRCATVKPMCHSAPVQPFANARHVTKACPITKTTIVSQTDRPVDSSEEPVVHETAVRLDMTSRKYTSRTDQTVRLYFVIPQNPKKAIYPHVLREGGIGTMSGLIKWFVSTPL